MTSGVYCQAFEGKKLPSDGNSWDLICRDFGFGQREFANWLVEYDGWVYVPDAVWYRFDPNTLKEEKLVNSEVPLPYGFWHDWGPFPEYKGLTKCWVSAHYGLVGWNKDYDFRQIRITDNG